MIPLALLRFEIDPISAVSSRPHQLREFEDGAEEGMQWLGQCGSAEGYAGFLPCVYPIPCCKTSVSKTLISRCAPIPTYAVKSAEPVAARVASDESLACHTAPLCPMNVPILDRYQRAMLRMSQERSYQSPVTPSRSIGLLSFKHVRNIVRKSAVGRMYLCKQILCSTGHHRRWRRSGYA
jgi:hypothetical protein